MAYKITDFTRSVAAGGSYPYGDVKDDPSGTLVNRLAMNDVWQFFQRIMADTAITPSSTPDNLTNGYQLVQALNTLYCRRFNGQAAAAGSPTGTYIPVIMSGLVNSGTYPAYNVSPGFFFYNGQYVFCPGGSGVIPPVTTLLLNISTSDAQPIANITTGHPPIPGPLCCALSVAVPWSTGVGIDNINAEIVTIDSKIAALEAEVAVSGWTTVPPATGWGTTGYAASYNINGAGYVEIRGVITNVSVATPSTTIFTLPVGFRPATLRRFSITIYNNNISEFIPGYIEIDSTGIATMIFSTTYSITTTNWYVYLDSINFFTL